MEQLVTRGTLLIDAIFNARARGINVLPPRIDGIPEAARVVASDRFAVLG